MSKGVRGSCSEAVAPDEKGGPGLMHGRGDHARVGWFARYWRPSDGCPAQPIMVESVHSLGDPRGVGRAVDPPPTGPDDPVEVGPYRVLGRLGAGGMGTFYLAESPAGARVAIKVIRPELAGDV